MYVNISTRLQPLDRKGCDLRVRFYLLASLADVAGAGDLDQVDSESFNSRHPRLRGQDVAESEGVFLEREWTARHVEDLLHLARNKSAIAQIL